jgi:hypothetical protein
MSRANCSRHPADGSADQSVGMATPSDGAKLAEDIGIAVLDLAERARAAGLSNIGHLLELVALEAGAEAAAKRWPADGPKG